MKSFEKRTSESMCSVFEHVSQITSKTDKEKILKRYGLHEIKVGFEYAQILLSELKILFKHFLWDFRFSDPYVASSYDTLHSDDLGKWGKHIWKLLLDVLEDRKKLGQLTSK